MEKEYDDSASIRMVMEHLASSGFTAIRNMNEVSQFYAYDIQACYGKKRLAFEIKERTFTSNKYETALFRREKYERIMEQARKDSIVQAYMVQIYTDGIFEITRLEDYISEEERYYAHTEHFANNNREVQKVLLYPHNKNKQFKI